MNNETQIEEKNCPNQCGFKTTDRKEFLDHINGDCIQW
jgi:hypothetical protein